MRFDRPENPKPPALAKPPAPAKPPAHMDRRGRGRPSPAMGAVAAASLGLLALIGCSGSSQASRQQEAVPVTIGSVVQKDVPVEVRAIGTVEPYSTVAIKALVDGELTRAAFEEGQDVKKGDLLFSIDPRPHRAALEQAQAALERDAAQLKNAEADLVRYKDLVSKDFVTQEQYDRMKTNADALAAVVNAAKAAVEDARIRLGYCTIRSPVNGRTGRLMVHQGNIVKANDVPLVVINQISPVNVAFSVPQQQLADIKRFQKAGKLKVATAASEGESDPGAGELTFLDNAVDVKTGTILLKATFPNDDRKLWPGQFVDVRLRLTIRSGALTVPSQAVQTGQQGQFVFVVKPDLTVESRPVVTAGTFEQLAVVEKGLQAGEKVVTDGQLRLVPGAKVEIKTAST